MRLRQASVSTLPTCSTSGIAVEKPTYPRELRQRICHIGVGRFHRAHQAHYLHQLLQLGMADGWGLCVIGLRAADRAILHALAEQDGLYSLWQTDGQHEAATVIGSIMQWIDASSDVRAALDALSDAQTRIVSLTVTEAGYCLDAQHALDLQHADIVHDLAHPETPRSAPGLLVRALALRHQCGSGGVTLMSCDNLVANGERLRGAVLAFAEQQAPALARWIADEVSFPSSMVDRITPACDAAREDRLRTDWGVRDDALVRCERWQQWILEDAFVAGRPAFEKVGVVLSDRVHAYEQLKVGLLNGGHSALSHLGLMLGHHKVHEAMADPLIRRWLDAYMSEVAQTLPAIAGVDVATYQRSLIARFSNPDIDDRLSRLAQDSTSKFQQVLLPPLLQRLAQPLPVPALSLTLALWMRFLSRLHDDAGARDAYLDTGKAALIEQARAAVLSTHSADFLASVLGLQASMTGCVHGEVDRHLFQLEQSGLRAHVGRIAERTLAAPG